MNNFKTVFAFEFLGFVKKKKNWTVLIIMGIISVLIAISPKIIGFFDDDEIEKYYVVNENSESLNKIIVENEMENLVVVNSIEDMNEYVINGDTTEFYVFTDEKIEYYTTEKENLYSTTNSEFIKIFKNFYLNNFLAEKGMLEEYTDIMSYLDNIETKRIEVDNSEFSLISEEDETVFEIKYTVGYALIMLMYITMMQFSSYIATIVANEKTTRTMESLIYATDTNSLIIGKVFGVFAATFLQIVLMCIALLIGINVAMSFGTNSTGDSMILYAEIFKYINFEYILFFLSMYCLGFLMNLFIFAALSSTITKIEELSSAISVGTIISMFSFFVAIGIFTMPQNAVIDKLVYFPLFTPMCMYAKYSLGMTSGFDIVYAIIVPVITIGLIAIFTSRMYKVGVLLYGTKPSNKELIKTIFSKEDN